MRYPWRGAVFAILLMALAAVMLMRPVHHARHADAAQAEEELLIGLIPEENIFRQMKRHRPLAEYLAGKLGIKVRFTILSRYPHIITRFVSRGMDGAFFGALTSVLAQESLNVEPIARPVNINGKTTVQGYVFTRKDTGITTVAQMRGKRGAFVDHATATGYTYALALVRRAGARDMNSFLSDFYFTGSHDAAVYSVLSGRADVGAAKGRIIERLKQMDPLLNDELVVISISPSLPDNTLAVRKDLPLELKVRLQQTLLAMHEDPKGMEALKALDLVKFVEAGPGEFRPVLDLAREAGVDIRNFDYNY